jgi:Uncharacterized conserved protein
MGDSQASSTNRDYTIAELSALVTSGRLRLPQFQRSFRWDAQDVLNLFDSILRGYPFGSLLLWQREAVEENVKVGALEVQAGARQDALWVVDGQQRITSLVNAVDPRGMADPRFALGYSLRAKKVVLLNRNEGSSVIPLPDLFDFARALEWLRNNPDVSNAAENIQEVAARLNRLSIPAIIMEEANEGTLREIFDRINSRGKRLNPAEIFDAIHGGPDRGLTTSGIAMHVNEQTRFGRLDDKVVVQALLVRRHPDITRDLHNEFSPSRRNVSAFPEENKEEAYKETERALVSAIRFLQQIAGVPHMTFLPFRFQLLVLTRFFALFPEPHDRNLELISRWFWRTSVGAETLGISGSQRDLRYMAKLIVPGKESSSVQRLIKAAELTIKPESDFTNLLDLTTFRTDRANSKVVLAALWNKHPVDVRTNSAMTPDELAGQLENDSTPQAATIKLAPDSVENAGSTANRLISFVDRQEFIARVSAETDLASLLLDKKMLSALQENRHGDFLGMRSGVLRRYLNDFLDARTAYGQEDRPPLEDFIFDDGDPAVDTGPLS